MTTFSKWSISARIALYLSRVIGTISDIPTTPAKAFRPPNNNVASTGPQKRTEHFRCDKKIRPLLSRRKEAAKTNDQTLLISLVIATQLSSYLLATLGRGAGRAERLAVRLAVGVRLT